MPHQRDSSIFEWEDAADLTIEQDTGNHGFRASLDGSNLELVGGSEEELGGENQALRKP